MLPCPFCGKQPDLTDPDTLHPSGLYWRVTNGIKHYISHKDREPDDNKVWGRDYPRHMCRMYCCVE